MVVLLSFHDVSSIRSKRDPKVVSICCLNLASPNHYSQRGLLIKAPINIVECVNNLFGYIPYLYKFISFFNNSADFLAEFA